MSTTTDKKNLIKPATQALSDKLRVSVALDLTTGVGTSSDTLFDDNLPSGLTPDTVKAVDEHRRTFNAAAIHAFGTLAHEAVATDPGLTKMNVTLPFGHKDKLYLEVGTAGADKDGKDMPMTVTSMVEEKAGSAIRDSIKAINAMFAEEAKEAKEEAAV